MVDHGITIEGFVDKVIRSYKNRHDDRMTSTIHLMDIVYEIEALNRGWDSGGDGYQYEFVGMDRLLLKMIERKLEYYGYGYSAGGLKSAAYTVGCALVAYAKEHPRENR